VTVGTNGNRQEKSSPKTKPYIDQALLRFVGEILTSDRRLVSIS
jgi:hypothetical protein